MIQLEFFQTEETVILRNDIRKVKESGDRTRKALFAKHGELEKKYNDLLSRLDILEKNICKGL